jgi:hypothetical protein
MKIKNLQTEEIANIGWGQFRVAKWGQTAVANSYAFTQFANLGHSLRSRHRPGRQRGWLFLRECFQRTNHDFLRRVVSATAEVRHHELFAVRVES